MSQERAERCSSLVSQRAPQSNKISIETCRTTTLSLETLEALEGLVAELIEKRQNIWIEKV